jgi:transcriptional regulator with XRE-family HTH domain
MTKQLDELAVDKIIGRNLRAFRLQKSLSQEQVAAAVKLTFQQVQKYEKGTNRIGGSRMAQFCQLLNVSPNDFLEASKASIRRPAAPSTRASWPPRKALRSPRRFLESKAPTTVA